MTEVPPSFNVVPVVQRAATGALDWRAHSLSRSRKLFGDCAALASYVAALTMH
jgi:hypothetical protein